MSEKTLKAGAIILSAINKDKILLLFRSDQKDWSFPKGHVEPGEEIIQGMLRELKEETGLEVEIVKTLPDLLYSNVRRGEICLKMFLVLSKDDSKIKTEHVEDKLEWVLLNNVNSKLSYDNLKDYFSLVLPMIKM